MARVSVIVPVLDEARSLGPLLDALAREAGAAGSAMHEVLVADGGSRDATVALARAHPLAPRVLAAPRGRARQMNAAARVATGDALWFVHADTRVPRGAVAMVSGAVARGVECGCFALAIDSPDARLRLAAAIISARSRAMASATGDQGIFVARALFARLGGYPDGWPLFEDLALVGRARRAGARWACLPARVGTSARRWEAQGVTRTIVRMWALRALYHAGVSPHWLARRYGRDVRAHGDAGVSAPVPPRAAAEATSATRAPADPHEAT